jgi:hypothetical protein
MPEEGDARGFTSDQAAMIDKTDLTIPAGEVAIGRKRPRATGSARYGSTGL